MTLETVVNDFLVEHGLTTESIVVAVSGGADSQALLLAVSRVYPTESVVVAHLNHGLRGAEAERDALVVQRVCDHLGVLCVVGAVDVPAMITETGFSAEEAARKARYPFLAGVAQRHNACFILTAHHADDQVETILINFLRGTGIAGLRGMLQLSSVPYVTDETLQLGRPMLEIERSEIELYCLINGIQFVEDSTNTDTTLFRNRIRHELLPILETYSRNLPRRLTQMAALLQDEEAILSAAQDAAWQTVFEQAGEGWCRLRKAAWLRLEHGLQRRVLRHALVAHKADLTNVGYTVLEQTRQTVANGAVGAVAVLPGGWLATVGYDSIVIAQRGVEPPVDAPQLESARALSCPCQGGVAGERLGFGSATCGQISHAAIVNNRDVWRAYVVVEGELMVRGRLAGERIRPIALNGSKSIRKS